MEYLPTPDEQSWLIEALAKLLRRRGTRHFLCWPLVEPTPRFFPDPWSFSIEGLDRVVRRLMQYADLGELEVQIGTYAQPGIRTKGPHSHIAESAAGLFLGIHSGCAYFGFNEKSPSDSEYMAGVMAHEVAHAYREFHGLADPADRDREEWRTDVTGVYLGFGLLLANNSDRHRTVGALGHFESSFQRVGYLTPQAFAFLLAIQMAARSLEVSEQGRLLKLLEANQAAFAKAARERILEWPEETLRTLQFPAEGDIIEDVAPESLLLPLPEVEVFQPSQTPGDATVYGPNRGRPVFRLTKTRAHQFSFLGLVAGIVASLPAAIPLHSSWVTVLFGGTGLALGWKAGEQRRADHCSDPACEAVLPPGIETCPGCGGVVAGSIRHASERLEAEEAYERKQAGKRRGRPMKRRKVRS